MKAWLLAAIAAATTTFSGCTTGPKSDSFQEIRVDAFSHYWATQQERGILEPGNRIVTPELDSNGTGYVDTLVLVKAEYDKTSQLPAHSFEVVESSFPGVIVYAVDREPEDFSCYHDNDGHVLSRSDTATPLFDLRGVRKPFIEGGEIEGEGFDWHAWYALKSVPEVLTQIPCGYAKGKGFYLGSTYGDDPFASRSDPSMGTLIIRYR